jgi:hypothetical protein
MAFLGRTLLWNALLLHLQPQMKQLGVLVLLQPQQMRAVV